MPIPSMAGVLASGGAGSSGAVFVTSANYDRPGSGSQAISFSGMSAGQLAIIWNVSNGARPSASGWNAINTGAYNLGYPVTLLWKVLTSADISAGSVTVTADAGFFTVQAWLGPTSAAVVSAADANGAPGYVTIPGYTKSGSFKGLIGLASLQNNGSGATTLVGPGTMVNRISNYQSTFFLATVADILNPANYTDGTAITFTANGSYFGLYGQLVELT